MQIYDYQQECLDAIESARQAGSKKALVVMATGLGKTVVSALQLKHMLKVSPGRTLYVTHQNEILRQARSTFTNILDSDISYGYFHGQEKHLRKVDVLFASFQTMALAREQFGRDEFKYIIVDEAHHVQADTYRPTVEYFQPDFIIGLTATPNRADQKDIGQLMGEPVFHLDLFEALADRHLTPISYRLMTDELQNLEVLDTPVGKLSIAELNRTIFVPKRDEEIVRIIEDRIANITHPRMMIFCASIAHAERLEAIMPNAILIHSKMSIKIRQERIDKFRSNQSATVITVDMFNEGIDIPETNVIVFLRSTSSRTVFLQQLGRGLRRVKGKEEVLVLDFVANCERIEMINYVQGAMTSTLHEIEANKDSSLKPAIRSSFTLTIAGGEFDERFVNLTAFIERVRNGYTKDDLKHQLHWLANLLGRVPSQMDANLHPLVASAPTFCRVFNMTWKGVVAETGVLESYGHTREKLTQTLLEFAKELGRTPGVADMQRSNNVPGSDVYRRVFGKTWNGVLKEVGLKLNHRYFTKEELTAKLVALIDEIGYVPTTQDLNGRDDMPTSKAYMRAFGGTWNEVLNELGLELNQSRYTPATKEQATERILALAKKLGRTPTQAQAVSTRGIPSGKALERLYGKTWNAILIEIGLPINHKQDGYTKEELAVQLIELTKRLGRVPMRRDIEADSSVVSLGTFKKVFNGHLRDITKELNLELIASNH
jgi:superfamily II DNA or RNA helicase